MKELLEFIAKRILPHPDDIQIDETRDEEGNIRLTLVTHPEDTGLAIGKGGKTAHAMRELLKIKAIQQNERVYLDIKSPEELEAEQNEAAQATSEETAAEESQVVAEETPTEEPTA